ncbi:MAG TPA: hypothetical protein VGE56_03690, partial [Rhodocyclaceae bacterium]
LSMLERGYRVIVSTHSPLLGDFAWAINRLRAAHKQGKADRKTVLKAFGLTAAASDNKIAASVLKCHARTYSMNYKGDTVRANDISALDSMSDDPLQASWGGLLDHSYRLATAIGQLDFDLSALDADARK